MAAALLAGAACAPADRQLDIRLGHVGAPGSLFALSAEEFARRANQRLGHRARVVVFGSSQLGSDEVMMQKLRLGTLELALPSTVMSTAVESFGLFEMPYLVRDREHMRRVEAAVIWPTLAPQAEAAGYKILAIWENGFRHITNNRRPIVTPEDLRGIKLRTPTGQWRIRTFRAFGANPSPMPLAETFVALQTGVMDGQENPFAQIYTSRLHEVQRYLSLTGHVYTPAYVTAGLAAWQRLPDDVRQVLETTARETQSYAYQTAERLDRELLQQLKGAGIQINQPDQAAFVLASRGVYAEFARAVPGGAAMVDTVVALAGR
ncbi:MAG TPA: TRAP transporter substrate-binding protein [Gemmatimonadales bacterium]|nr:TRAP transporter substrate-binding protein [Gemmatimonadales bacterium]